MKRKDLLKRFYAAGWRVIREGANHTVLSNGKDREVIPRHSEINELLSAAIIRRRGL